MTRRLAVSHQESVQLFGCSSSSLWSL